MKSFQLARELNAVGVLGNDLRRMRRAGQLDRIRHGVYAPPAERDSGELHRLLIESTIAVGQAESVASFGSAAVLHDLPVWSAATSKVHLTRNRADSGRIRPLVHVHVARLTEADLTAIDDIPVTSLPRTFVDHARTVPLEQAVAAGDRAVRNGMDLAEVSEQLDRASARRGIGRARYAAALLDPASESPGESVSRVIFHDHGLPAPLLQVTLFDDAGAPAGRVDFLWPEEKVIGEFDGRIKYGELLLPDETAGDAVFREKVREDRLRDLGYVVVRWVWSDFAHPELLVERIRKAFARGRSRTVIS